jgi:hypothetical protein
VNARAEEVGAGDPVLVLFLPPEGQAPREKHSADCGMELDAKHSESFCRLIPCLPCHYLSLRGSNGVIAGPYGVNPGPGKARNRVKGTQRGGKGAVKGSGGHKEARKEPLGGQGKHKGAIKGPLRGQRDAKGR